MPHIDRVTLHYRCVALRRPFVTTARTARVVDALIGEVMDGDGGSRWGGTSTIWRVADESTASVAVAVGGPLREAKIGRGVDDPGALSDAPTCDHGKLVDTHLSRLRDPRTHRAPRRRSPVSSLGGPDEEVRTDMTSWATIVDESPNIVLATALEHAKEDFAPPRSKWVREATTGRPSSRFVRLSDTTSHHASTCQHESSRRRGRYRIDRAAGGMRRHRIVRFSHQPHPNADRG